MKKFIYTLGLALTLASCGSDYLDTAPQSSVGTETILESTDNAALVINGICRLMANQYLSTQGMNGEGTIKTWYNNLMGNDHQRCNQTGWATLYNGNYIESSSSKYNYYVWFYYYKLISNANAVICNIDSSSGTEAEREFIKAQALTFRAYSYAQLVQFFCYRWDDSSSGTSRGLPLRLDESTGDLEASTLIEVYDQIYADLDEAIELYTSSGMDRDDDEYYLPNLEVAYAAYARAALARQDYSTAITYARLARANYSLMSEDDYTDSGFNTPNDEWIWGIYSASDQTLYYYSYFAYQASNSSASVCRSYPIAISKDLIDQIPETDVRRDMFLIPTDEEAEEIGYAYATRTSSGTLYSRAKSDYSDKLYSSSYIFPYMQFKFQCTESPGIGEFNIIRASEMYYIEAEALCEQGGSDSTVQSLLNTLNSRFDSSYSCTATGSSLLEEVKLYRRFDLWGEGFDWTDLKRWNEPIERRSVSDGGSFLATFAISTAVSDNNKWTYVYPDYETDYNTAL